MAPKKNWFKKAIVEKQPNTLDGWRKEMPAEKRRSDAISSRPASWSNKKKYLSVARALQALANVTTDADTAVVAKQDADYFFGKVKGKKKMEVGGNVTDRDRTEHYRYIDIQKVKNGLKVSINQQGIEEVEELRGQRPDQPDYSIWADLFEDVQGNSEYIFHSDMGESGFGLTSAEGITDGYHYGDKGGFDTDFPKSAKVYWFPNYQVESALDTMIDTGSVIFTEAKAAGGYMKRGGKVKEKPISKDLLPIIEKEATQPDANKYKYRWKILWGQDIVLKEDMNNKPIEKFYVKNFEEGTQLAEILNYNSKVKAKGGYMKNGGQVSEEDFQKESNHYKEYLELYIKVREKHNEIAARAIEMFDEICEKAKHDPEIRAIAYKWLTTGSTLVLWELSRKIGWGNIVNDPYPYLNFNAASLMDTVALYYREKDKTLGEGKFERGGVVDQKMLHQMANGYKSAILFTETDDEEEPLDANYSIHEFDAETANRIGEMMYQYISENLDAINASGLDYDTIGNDIWYAQSGQGAGFFDHSIDKEVEDKLTKGAKKFVDLSAHVFIHHGKVTIEGGWFSNKFEGGGIVKGFINKFLDLSVLTEKVSLKDIFTKKI